MNGEKPSIDVLTQIEIEIADLNFLKARLQVTAEDTPQLVDAAIQKVDALLRVLDERKEKIRKAENKFAEAVKSYSESNK